jgi:hypothetical protein
MKYALYLIIAFAIFSCNNRDLPPPLSAETQRYDTLSDTNHYKYDKAVYETICEDLFISSYTPEAARLSDKPNSYFEWISDRPNWTKEQYEEVLKSSGGLFYLDTTDRDGENFRYNHNGLLMRYENKRFGDMIHSECLFFYNDDSSIAEIRINDLVADNLKYRNRTVQIGPDGLVTEIKHYVVSVSNKPTNEEKAH